MTSRSFVTTGASPFGRGTTSKIVKSGKSARFWHHHGFAQVNSDANIFLPKWFLDLVDPSHAGEWKIITNENRSFFSQWATAVTLLRWSWPFACITARLRRCLFLYCGVSFWATNIWPWFATGFSPDLVISTKKESFQPCPGHIALVPRMKMPSVKYSTL